MLLPIAPWIFRHSFATAFRKRRLLGLSGAARPVFEAVGGLLVRSGVDFRLGVYSGKG